MLQATFPDSLLLDLLSHLQDFRTAPVIDIGGRQALTASTGGDANIGPRLPGMLRRTGLAEVGMQVHQPAGLGGYVKLITPLTMQGIADRVVEAGLATPEDVRRIVAALTAAATDPEVAMSTPRVFQPWGRKP